MPLRYVNYKCITTVHKDVRRGNKHYYAISHDVTGPVIFTLTQYFTEIEIFGLYITSAEFTVRLLFSVRMGRRVKLRKSAVCGRVSSRKTQILW